MAKNNNLKIGKFLKMLRENNAVQALEKTDDYRNKKVALVRYWGTQSTNWVKFLRTHPSIFQ